MRKYTLSNEDTEMWRARSDDAAEGREFTRATYAAGEAPGTKIEIHDAWGQLLEVFEV